MAFAGSKTPPNNSHRPTQLEPSQYDNGDHARQDAAVLALAFTTTVHGLGLAHGLLRLTF
jgi:hypothetical protein